MTFDFSPILLYYQMVDFTHIIGKGVIMIQTYKELYEGATGEIIEKKSRFIATIVPIRSEDDAAAFIEQTKKANWNATHNCSAYTLGTHDEITRFSDDGEPGGTAGKPMLDVLLGEKIHNCAVVVTRYFGGTLLGTGGLIRAYQAAVKEALAHCILADKILGHKLCITTSYNEIGKLQYTAAQMDLYLYDTTYTDIVTSYLMVPTHQLDAFLKKWSTQTNGQEQIEDLGMYYFAHIGQEIKLYDETPK